MWVYKYGAAPTYVRKGKAVTRITGASLPAGLSAGEGGRPRRDHAEAGAGGTWYCWSATEWPAAGKDQWLRDMFSAFEGDSPKDLACALIDESDGKEVGPDDPHCPGCSAFPGRSRDI